MNIGPGLPTLSASTGLASAGRAVPRLRQGITLADVWFRYGDDGPWVLRGVTAELAFGQATALVGVLADFQRQHGPTYCRPDSSR